MPSPLFAESIDSLTPYKRIKQILNHDGRLMDYMTKLRQPNGDVIVSANVVANGSVVVRIYGVPSYKEKIFVDTDESPVNEYYWYKLRDLGSDTARGVTITSIVNPQAQGIKVTGQCRTVIISDCMSSEEEAA
jgi:hypothetical protein